MNNNNNNDDSSSNSTDITNNNNNNNNDHIDSNIDNKNNDNNDDNSSITLMNSIHRVFSNKLVLRLIFHHAKEIHEKILDVTSLKGKVIDQSLSLYQMIRYGKQDLFIQHFDSDIRDIFPNEKNTRLFAEAVKCRCHRIVSHLINTFSDKIEISDINYDSHRIDREMMNLFFRFEEITNPPSSATKSSPLSSILPSLSPTKNSKIPISFLKRCFECSLINNDVDMLKSALAWDQTMTNGSASIISEISFNPKTMKNAANNLEIIEIIHKRLKFKSSNGWEEIAKSAARWDNVDVVRFIALHRHLDITEDVYNFAAGAPNNQCAVLKFLYENPPNVLSTSKATFLAYTIAAKAHNLSAIKLLNSNRADKNYCTSSALGAAMSAGYLDIVDYLLGNIECVDDYGKPCKWRVSDIHPSLLTLEFVQMICNHPNMASNFHSVLATSITNKKFDITYYILSLLDTRKDVKPCMRLALVEAVRVLAEDDTETLDLVHRIAAIVEKESLDILIKMQDQIETPTATKDRSLQLSTTSEIILLLRGKSRLDLIWDMIDRYRYVLEFDTKVVANIIETGSLALVKLISITPAAETSFNHLAIDTAAKLGYIDIVQYLQTNRTEGSLHAIKHACTNGRLSMVQYLVEILEKNPQELARRSHIIRDAIFQAAINNHLDVVRYFTAKKFDCWPSTLESVVERGHVEMVEHFIAQGGSYFNSRNLFPCMEAAILSGQLECMKLLLLKFDEQTGMEDVKRGWRQTMVTLLPQAFSQYHSQTIVLFLSHFYGNASARSYQDEYNYIQLKTEAFEYGLIPVINYFCPPKKQQTLNNNNNDNNDNNEMPQEGSLYRRIVDLKYFNIFKNHRNNNQ